MEVSFSPDRLEERTIGRDYTELQLVAEHASEDSSALPSLDVLVPRIFDELRELARRQLSHEHDRFTLQTTELVHEAYLRLANDKRVTTRGRAYFYAAASRAMRQVLIEAARARGAVKRGE